MLETTRSGGQFDGLAVRRVSVGFGPGFLARFERRSIGQAFGHYQTLKSREPMLIVARAVVGVAAVRRSLELSPERLCPLAPGEMPLFGELHGERERLRLPRL